MNTLLENQRFCPNCGIKLNYLNKYVARRNEKLKATCRPCAYERKKEIFGEKHHRFGVKDTPEQIKIKSERERNRKRSPEEIARARETIKIASAARAGKNNYDLWLEKYGRGEADRRMEVYRKKQSEANSGSKNKMFGKPSPRGAGNGWKGWYKGFYFRSLRELCFYLEYLDTPNVEWESGEKKMFAIPYIDYFGKPRNYFPDFIMGSEIIECKPQRLWDTPLVKLKATAAENFARNNSMTYKMIDVIINSDLIKSKFLAGEIKFENRYLDKIEKYYGIN